MRFVIQRVQSSNVKVNGKVIGNIGKGLMVLVGISKSDTKLIADYMIKKLINMRIFTDEYEKLNLSLKDVNGELLLISQFTLYGDCSQGNRPSFSEAAGGNLANELYEYIIEECKKSGLKVQNGIFGADMQVELVNDGPVTIILEK